jgi:hypothetical protein
MAKTVSGRDQGNERKRTIDEVSKYLRWLNTTGKQLTTIDGMRILQILAILCLCLMLFIICHKGFTDILVLIQENPDDFLRALLRYFMDNLAG